MNGNLVLEMSDSFVQSIDANSFLAPPPGPSGPGDMFVNSMFVHIPLAVIVAASLLLLGILLGGWFGCRWFARRRRKPAPAA